MKMLIAEKAVRAEGNMKAVKVIFRGQQVIGWKFDCLNKHPFPVMPNLSEEERHWAYEQLIKWHYRDGFCEGPCKDGDVLPAEPGMLYITADVPEAGLNRLPMGFCTRADLERCLPGYDGRLAVFLGDKGWELCSMEELETIKSASL